MLAAEKRKERTEKKLKSLNVAVNVHLPLIESGTDVSIRTKEDIINRIISLTIVSAKAMEAPPAKMEEFIRRYDAMELFTDKEKAYIMNPDPNQNDLILYSWKPECLWVLLWSVNLIPELDLPLNMCNPEFIFKTVLSKTKQELIHSATVKSSDEILEQLDFIYRAHWAVRESEIKQLVLSGELDPDVVYERHYTFNWIVNLMDEDWEEVSTNT